MIRMQHISLSFRWEHDFHVIIQGVVDDQIDKSFLSIPSGMAVDVRIFNIFAATIIYLVSHESIPEEHRKIVRARIKGFVLQKSVIGRCESIVEYHTVGIFREAAQFIECAFFRATSRYASV